MKGVLLDTLATTQLHPQSDQSDKSLSLTFHKNFIENYVKMI